jgi:hypothetical protein
MKRIIFALVVLAAAGGDALAVPASFSFTGRLADDGVPVDGSITLGLELFDVASGGSALWSESHATTADNGLISVAMGGQAALDPADFGGGDLWLAVTVEGQTMSPRLQVRSVPYAMRAEICDDAEAIGGIPAAEVQQVLDSSCAVGTAIRNIGPTGTVTCEPAGVPAGAIAFFGVACPSGWTEYTALQGRTILGVPAGGTIGGSNATVTSLGNQGARNLTQAPAHSHDVDPPNSPAAATGTGSTHQHTVDPPPWSITGGSHSHNILTGTGIAAGESVRPQFSRENTNQGTASTETDSSHTHSFDAAAFTLAQSGNHAHDVNLAPFDTEATGTNVAVGGVDVAMPYIQLRACQKN